MSPGPSLHPAPIFGTEMVRALESLGNVVRAWLGWRMYNEQHKMWAHTLIAKYLNNNILNSPASKQQSSHQDCVSRSIESTFPCL